MSPINSYFQSRSCRGQNHGRKVAGTIPFRGGDDRCQWRRFSPRRPQGACRRANRPAATLPIHLPR